MSRYERLDAAAVRATVGRLQRRIQTRFPDRNLSEVATEIARAIDDELQRPRPKCYLLKKVLSWVGIVFVVAVTALVFVLLGMGVASGEDVPELGEWGAVVETLINDVVFAGIAIFFLWKVPERIQRGHDLEALHRLRSLAHIIDMHQLDKDPEHFTADYRPTAASERTDMTIHDLWSYLDYCNEMLSLVAKAAALFAEHNDDDSVLAAVAGIEDLTSNLSQTIAQKIMLLRALEER